MDTETLKEFLTTAGVNLLFGIIILIVGLFLSSSVIRVLKKKAFAKIDPALQAFLLNAIKLLLYIVVVLSAANVIGIPLTSIITIFASSIQWQIYKILSIVYCSLNIPPTIS